MEKMRSADDVAARKGPAATLEALYRAEHTGMVRLAFTLIGNAAESEEVVQESFVDISFTRLSRTSDGVDAGGGAYSFDAEWSRGERVDERVLVITEVGGQLLVMDEQHR